MPGKVSEVRWERAKQIVRQQYPKISETSDRFWALVNAVYRRTVEKSTSAYVIKATPENVPAQPRAVRQWEPPGGSHPKTFRARVGDKYIYRPATQQEQRSLEGKADLFTGEQLRTLRSRFRAMTPEKHRQEAKRAHSKIMHDLHNFEAMRKEDLQSLLSTKRDDGQKPRSSGTPDRLGDAGHTSGQPVSPSRDKLRRQTSREKS